MHPPESGISLSVFNEYHYKSGIFVAEYLTVLPPKELLQAKLQQAIATAHRRLPYSKDEP